LVRKAGVDYTGSYRAGLTRHLRKDQIKVIEVISLTRPRRRHGTTNPAHTEAARALSRRATTISKPADRPIKDLQTYKIAAGSWH
jgi:hypothetical protein